MPNMKVTREEVYVDEEIPKCCWNYAWNCSLALGGSEGRALSQCPPPRSPLHLALICRKRLELLNPQGAAESRL